MLNQYLQSILRKYSTAPRIQQVGIAYNTLHRVLAPWAGNLLHTFQPSGSFAKGTSIILGTDLDIFFCVSHQCTDNLRDIYKKTRTRLLEAGFHPREQNVSIRVVSQGVTCDIVPARKLPGNHHQATLYRRRADTWTLTNVHNHIQLIVNSGRRDEIRLIKIWLSLNGMDLPSFFVELLILTALIGAPYGDLSNNVIKVLQFIQTRARTVRLIDPSNTNNIVSEDLTIQERNQLSLLASRAINGTWNQFVW